MQKVKTGLDSGFKQVIRELRPAFLFSADRQAVKRRYIAGNYAYICLTENFEQLPHETPAVRWKVLPERRSVFEKSRPGGVRLCSIPQVLAICREE
ncbi:hypothetical protein QYR00_05755 [Agrobacterium tumefaciens]|nr:hypothetical protein QYR00_05755 [Agrobacterium tumefaciens]